MISFFKSKYFLLLILIATISITFTQTSFYRKIANSQSLINQVYTQVFSTYVDQLDPEAFTKSSINSITENLDPYTTLLVEDEQYNINLLTDGKYGGVGIQLGYRDKEMTVISPMIDSPAQKAGIIGGDIIVKIDETDVKDLSFNDAAAKIRGRRGTKVKLTVKRYGVADPLQFDLTRSRIDVKDVTYAGMISPQTGYIRLNRFSRFTPRDFQKELLEMNKQNLSELIIDLRDNTGGLLSAAVNILDMLVDKELPLVSTKGRTKESNRAFFSKRDPIISNDIKINEGSASASEIVAGAIQDLDRGLVLGKKSFGKGLVQTAYEVDKKRTLKITTARYFIPSGRFIQKRDYIDKKFLLNQAVEDSLFKTKSGRIVYGNGGITPDSTVNETKMSVITTQYWRKGYFYSYAQKNKFLYNNFDEVERDANLTSKFIDFTKDRDQISLPGKKELSLLEKSLQDLDSTNLSIKQAVQTISDFYESKIVEKTLDESNDMRDVLLLEFAGLFNGPKGRIEQSFKTDNVLKAAKTIISDQYLYSYTFKNHQNLKN